MASTERRPPPDGVVLSVPEVALRLAPGGWDYAQRHAPAIAADWAARRAAKPALFNGRFFLLARFTLTGERFEGCCVETDYASYLHWRAAGFPDRVWNAFAMPVVQSAEGALLIARMAGWTANAGLWYPPAGSLDGGDLRPDGGFDLIGNMRRELREEVGLDLAPEAFASGWDLVFESGRVACLAPVTLATDAATLLAQARAHLAREARPELDAVLMLSPGEPFAHLPMPPFLSAYLTHRIATASGGAAGRDEVPCP